MTFKVTSIGNEDEVKQEQNGRRASRDIKEQNLSNNDAMEGLTQDKIRL